MGTVQEMPPRGHYLADEVGRLAGVSGNKIGQWLHHGYIDASQSGDGYPKVYAFQDVAEAILVHALIEDHGLALKQIRSAIEYVRAEYPYDWPLQNANLEVGPGRAITSGDVDVSRGGQPYLVPPDELQRVAALLDRGGWAAREITNLRHIEVNPNRLSGRPAIRGRRIAAQDVAQIAATPGGQDLLRDDYELTDAEIHDAVLWWEKARGYEAAA